MAATTIRVQNESGTEWEITLDPDNWATEHMQRQIDAGDLKVIGTATPVKATKKTVAKKKVSADERSSDGR